MRVLDRAVAPAAQVIPVAVENHHRRILALENVDAVPGIGRNAADHSHGFALGHPGKIAHQFVGMLARAELCHGCLSLCNSATLSAMREPCLAPATGIDCSDIGSPGEEQA